MPVYEKKWWQKLFKKEEEARVDSLRDIQAIKDFIKHLHEDIRPILPTILKLEELEKERKVAKVDIIKTNLQAQALNLDKLLKHYQFLVNDVEINSIRLKKISGNVLQECEKHGLDSVVAKRKKNIDWTFGW